MLVEQSLALFSTGLIFVLSAILAAYLTMNYAAKKTRSLLYWSAGMWVFAISVLLEVVFALGIYSQPLIKSYLFLVSLLVELLALGSIQLVGARAIRYTYYIFTILSTIVALYFVAVSYIGYIITGYIVYGPLPLSVTLISSIITFPAAVILVVVAAVSYWRTHSKKMLSIIAGTVVVSIAGTLYIVQFPAFLYYAEFIGILLLWLGFFSRKKIAS
ncbi:MAG: hypothetical protein QXH66_07205 [Conexivisphaerales archaeon]